MSTIWQHGGRQQVGRRGGFSLVELIVASAITVVLAALLIGVTSGMLSAWNRSRGKLTASNQAKLALDQIADDLEGLVFRADANVWLAATLTGQQTSTGDAGISDAAYPTGGASNSKPSGVSILLTPTLPLEELRFGHVGTWLRFFTTETAANDAVNSVSAIRAVSYQIARVPVSGVVGSGRRYFLFRSSVRPGSFDATGSPLSNSPITRSTFATGYDIGGDNAYNTPTTANSGQTEPGSIRRPDRTQLIGNDVIDFGVRIYVRDAAGNLVERFPLDRTVGTPPPVWSFAATTAPSVTLSGVGVQPSGVSAVVRGVPVVVEVMFRVLSDEGALLILALESGKIVPPGGAGAFDTYWWEIATANSTVFARRIEISSSGVSLQ